jgi:hypothetical protein
MIRDQRFLIFPAALTLSILACNTVMSRIPQGVRATATGPGPAVQASPAVTATAPAVAGESPLPIAGGPVVGSQQETRTAIEEQIRVLEQLAGERYSEAELTRVGQTFPFTVRLEENQPVIWTYGWCTTTQAILEQNLARMTLEFSVNGAPVDLGQFHVLDRQSSSLACRFYAAVVYDWPTGTTTLESRITYTEPINDGFFDYPEGVQTFVYTVTAP